jgi:lysophospholipase L1-like esterase
VDSAGYYEGVPLDVTIEVNGSLIKVYIDGEAIFSVSDSGISLGTIALYCQDNVKFDNVLVTENSLAPSVVISSPVAYSIEVSDTVVASAIATNFPQGGKVEFVLDDDDSTKIVEFFSPYEAQFNSVSQGEHKMDVILRDVSGSELARDTNEGIGVLGDYYVAVGDSITNGIGDDNPSDNTSQDGRIIAIQGYEANLNDLLTSTLGYPHIIFNEGIGGDKALDALGRINSIIVDRHPLSNKVLILLGTNDSGGGVSATTFRTQMQSLVNTVVASGKEAWVALIPPVFLSNGNPDAARNNLIQQYNNVIVNQIVDPQNNIYEGPDFYTFFLDKFGTHYADTIHPNGLGYEAMANEWNDILDQ